MTRLDELAGRAAVRRRWLDAAVGEARSVVTRLKTVEAQVADLDAEVKVLEQTTGLLNSLSEERQTAAQATIEELVTRGLQTIFDPSLSFIIVQGVKGNAASVEFLIRKAIGDAVIETPVLEAQGGGLSATVGFLLRVVVLLLRGEAAEGQLLVLDETFAHVSDDYVPRVAAFLREVVDRTGIRIVMVTHQQDFTEFADKVYRFSQKDGITQVTVDP